MTKRPAPRLIRLGSVKRETRASFMGKLAEGLIRYNQP
jgi:hypothetical protein